MPRVSIIMPAYNRSWIIERAVKSVLAQTMTDFELIIIDDGSTDDTVQKIKQFDDSRIILHELHENKGQSVARNTGIKMSNSDLIAYLDTDNVWLPNYLEVMTSEFSDEYVLLYSSQNVFLCSGSRDDLKIIGRKVRDYEYNPNIMKSRNFIDTNCAMHRKSVLDEVGMFDESLKEFEDWDLFARICLKHPFKVKHVGQVLSEYYFFLRGATSTLQNGTDTDEWIKERFNIKEYSGDGKIISEKIKKQIKES